MITSPHAGTVNRIFSMANNPHVTDCATFIAEAMKLRPDVVPDYYALGLVEGLFVNDQGQAPQLTFNARGATALDMLERGPLQNSFEGRIAQSGLAGSRRRHLANTAFFGGLRSNLDTKNTDKANRQLRDVVIYGLGGVKPEMLQEAVALVGGADFGPYGSYPAKALFKNTPAVNFLRSQAKPYKVSSFDGVMGVLQAVFDIGQTYEWCLYDDTSLEPGLIGIMNHERYRNGEYEIKLKDQTLTISKRVGDSRIQYSFKAFKRGNPEWGGSYSFFNQPIEMAREFDWDAQFEVDQFIGDNGADKNQAYYDEMDMKAKRDFESYDEMLEVLAGFFNVAIEDIEIMFQRLNYAELSADKKSQLKFRIVEEKKNYGIGKTYFIRYKYGPEDTDWTPFNIAAIETQGDEARLKVYSAKITDWLRS